MKKQMLIMMMLIVVGMLIGVGGCCSIMSGSTQRVEVTSIPPGARVTADDGSVITTPGVITLTRKDAHILTAELPGYKTCLLTFHHKWNGWLQADLFWDFGIFSCPIDFASGAAYTLTPTSKCFRFMPSE